MVANAAGALIGSHRAAAGGGPATPYSLWPGFDWTGSDQYEAQAYALGTRFRSSAAGSVTKVRWHLDDFPGTQTTKPWRIYRHSDSALLASGTIATPNGNNGGAHWAEAVLDPPLAIASGTDYVVVVDVDGNNDYYSTGGPFYDSGPVAGEGPLTNVEGYYSTTQGVMPASTYNYEGYGVDVIVEV